jgi:probable HAF family extracellular repeat protein
LAVSALALLVSATALADEGDTFRRYTAHQLEAPEPGAVAAPVALNDAGQVAVTAYVPSASRYESYVTGPDGSGLTPLCPNGPECEVRAINNVGDVVGSRWNSRDGEPTAFIGHAGDHELRELEGLQNGYAYSFANGINDDGVVVGETFRQAFRTEPGAKGYVNLGALGDQRHKSTATAINDAGEIVGNSGGAEHANVRRGFVTSTDAGRLLGLGQLPGAHNRSAATAISADGLVVGSSESHAVAWGKDRAAVDLGTLTGPTGYSYASGVNSQGLVVGWSWSAVNAWHAFVSDVASGEMADLNGLVDGLPPGTVLSRAYAINERGQIAVGTLQGLSFLLTPEDPAAPAAR